jgi:hypothetical protein
LSAERLAQMENPAPRTSSRSRAYYRPRGGKLAFERYSTPMALKACATSPATKTVTGMVGIAIDRGLLPGATPRC